MKKLTSIGHLALVACLALFGFPQHALAASDLVGGVYTETVSGFDAHEGRCCKIRNGMRGATGATGPAGVGAPGATGAAGATGATGVGTPGLPGAPGAPGATGLAGASAIIPYASGLPVTLTTTAPGTLATAGIVGFGNSASNITLQGNTIDLTGAEGSSLSFAFSCPTNGAITSIAGYFSSVVDFTLDGTTTITAQLYSSTPPSNMFTLIPEAAVILAPPLTVGIALGESSNGVVNNLNIPVTAGTRLLLVFSASTNLADALTILTGYAGGGVSLVVDIPPP